MLVSRTTTSQIHQQEGYKTTDSTLKLTLPTQSKALFHKSPWTSNRFLCTYLNSSSKESPPMASWSQKITKVLIRWSISKGKISKCITWKSSWNLRLRKKSKKGSLKSGKSLARMKSPMPSWSKQLEVVNWPRRTRTMKRCRFMYPTFVFMISILFSAKWIWKLSK